MVFSFKTTFNNMINNIKNTFLFTLQEMYLYLFSPFTNLLLINNYSSLRINDNNNKSNNLNKNYKNYKSYNSRELKMTLNNTDSMFNNQYLLKFENNDYNMFTMTTGLSFGGLHFKPNRTDAYYCRNAKDIKYISKMRNMLMYLSQMNKKTTKKKVYKSMNNDKFSVITFYIKRLKFKYLSPLIHSLYEYNSEHNKWMFLIKNKEFFEKYFSWISLGTWLRENKMITSKKDEYTRLSLNNLNYNDMLYLQDFFKRKFNLDTSIHKTGKKDIYRIYFKMKSTERIRMGLSYYFTIEFINEMFENDPRDGRLIKF
uniref:LADLIDADG maturase/endonuclease-like protein n=1 Tax=Ogataea parapolymorpha (strain ATCC 26012 / BCRC 20466 / JCM 22074 / NRRL Y-7560 / DL-1) TaxID=871575 RepID=E7E833_OGAPD|nr:LADLIDADG maturase/endonuclease-like protein [Ogataea polymorpha]ADT63564.1 LADLIDADG maturase/endonuclease-like protein [Ogataea polymorpha]